MDYIEGIWKAFANLMHTFNVYDVIDISIVAFLIYSLIKVVRDTRAGQLIKGIAIILFAYIISCQFHFRMLSTILSNFFQFSVFGLLIVFQPELRRALEHLGQSKISEYWVINSVKRDKNAYLKKYLNLIDITAESAVRLSDEKMGALIVFERKTNLGEIISTGTVINSKPSSALICNIFYNKAPLHDGALIIKNGVLFAGGCILPLTKNKKLSHDLGTRHRAAIGVSESTDAVAVVVSEETGKISIAVNGVLKTYADMQEFKNALNKLLIKPM